MAVRTVIQRGRVNILEFGGDGGSRIEVIETLWYAPTLKANDFCWTCIRLFSIRVYQYTVRLLGRGGMSRRA